VTAATDGSINTGQTFTPLDNQPATFSGDTAGSVEEYVTPTILGTLVVADTDSSTDVVVQTAAASDNGYGTFNIDAAGNWTFMLTPGNAAIKALNTGETLSDFLSVETADGTTTKIDITIEGITDIKGTTGNDKNPPIVGTDVRELINALKGNDEVYGQGGADIIIGAAGADLLHGGKGGDSFLYDEKTTGLTRKTMDLIADFSSKQHDVIDLTAIDAKSSTSLDDAFHIVANKAQAADKLGSLWISKGDGHDIVYINNDASHAGFDMAVNAHTGTHLGAGDFLL
jgi:VCBS repeat-containing protein